MRQVIDVERLLSWAYREELPKLEADRSVAPGFQFGDLGGRVDDWSHEPGFPAALGPPHPDAVAVDAAVQAMRIVEIDWNASRHHLAPDCLMLIGPGDITITRLNIDPRPWVVMHAKMGTRPDVEVTWRLDRQRGARGRPVIVGIDEKQRYRPGAHCPLTVVPDPREVVADRAMYGVWWASLASLAAQLAESLTDFLPVEPAVSEAPWLLTEFPPAPTVLPDLTAAKVSRP